MAESEKKWPLFKLNSVFVVLFSLGCAAYSLSLPMGTLQAPGAGGMALRGQRGHERRRTHPAVHRA